MGCYYADIRTRLSRLQPTVYTIGDWNAAVKYLTPTQLGKINQDERLRDDPDLIMVSYGKQILTVQLEHLASVLANGEYTL